MTDANAEELRLYAWACAKCGGVCTFVASEQEDASISTGLVCPNCEKFAVVVAAPRGAAE